MPDVLVVVERVDDVAGREKEERFEEGVGHEMEHAGAVSADPNREEHVADLTHRRVGEDALDVDLGGADGRRVKGGDPTDHGDGRGRARRPVVEQVHARHQVDAGRDHGGGVDQRRYRGRAFHGVGQPGVERELRRFRHRADQQEQADGGDDGSAFRQLMNPAEKALIVENPEVEEDQEGREDHADVADRVHDESLAGRQHRRRALEPEADQEIRAETDAGPADDQPDEISGEDEQEHREHEEVHVGEEARVSRILPHVADRVDVDQKADPGDHQDHQGRERVDVEVEGDVEVAALPPGEVGLVELLTAEHLGQDRKGQKEGQSDAPGADPAHHSPREQPPEERVDQEPRERRQEDQRREDVHRATPSSDRARRHPSAGRPGRPAR